MAGLPAVSLAKNVSARIREARTGTSGGSAPKNLVVPPVAMGSDPGARTVNPTHIVTERPSRALVASTCRRLQRFFQHVILLDHSGNITTAQRIALMKRCLVFPT